jgi:hypothetical protein
LALISNQKSIIINRVVDPDELESGSGILAEPGFTPEFVNDKF